MPGVIRNSSEKVLSFDDAVRVGCFKIKTIPFMNNAQIFILPSAEKWLVIEVESSWGVRHGCTFLEIPL